VKAIEVVVTGIQAIHFINYYRLIPENPFDNSEVFS
jgi:hypothetical protein